jgi:hypothetical protein
MTVYMSCRWFCVSMSGRVRHNRITEHSIVIAEDVLLLGSLAFVEESSL